MYHLRGREGKGMAVVGRGGGGGKVNRLNVREREM